MHSFPIYTVTEVTERIKTILRSDNELFQIWVKGEISNLKLHSSAIYIFPLRMRQLS